MAVNWQCTNCAAYIEAQEFDTDSEEWTKFWHLREALIFALLVTEFPEDSEWAITEDNWKETYLRLNMLECVNGTYRTADEGQVFITPEEVHSMIGLAVNAGTQTMLEFTTNLIHKKELDARNRLRRFIEASEEH